MRHAYPFSAIVGQDEMRRALLIAAVDPGVGGVPEAEAAARAAAASPRALAALLPFLRPYRGRIALAGAFLVLAAASTLLLPVALKGLIDQGLVAADPGERLMALRGHFLALFGVGAALGLFSAARFYMVTWLGERITADLRNAVYAHVVRQSPEFFESTQTGEVVSRLTADTTLVQTVVGSSLSMGLRNTVMGAGALVALIVTNPWVMTQVLGILVLVVLPGLYLGAGCAASAAPARTAWPTRARSRPRCSTRTPSCRATCRRGGRRHGSPPPRRAPSRPRASAPGCARRWWPS